MNKMSNAKKFVKNHAPAFLIGTVAGVIGVFVAVEILTRDNAYIKVTSKDAELLEENPGLNGFTQRTKFGDINCRMV